MLDVCHLKRGLFEVKDELGADNVRPWRFLPTILCIQRNFRACQLLDLGDFIQSIGHHELGDVGVCAYRNQNCRRLLRGRLYPAWPVSFPGDPNSTLVGLSFTLLLLIPVIG